MVKKKKLTLKGVLARIKKEEVLKIKSQRNKVLKKRKPTTIDKLFETDEKLGEEFLRQRYKHGVTFKDFVSNYWK
jgi:hypothetical protein